ncbi:MAG: Ig-like domain-containing protein [Myxococcota bacterium]
MQFQEPVRIRFKPDTTKFPRGVAPSSLRVATLAGGKWRLLPTSFPEPGVIEGETTHFSLFGLVSPCLVSGIGVDFPLANCPNLNPRIQASAPVALWAMGGRQTLLIAVEAAPGASASSVTLTISGLRPSLTYHLLRDGQGPPVAVLADASGQLQTSESTAGRRYLVLMATHGSIDLDASSCVPPLGIWTSATSTCALTQDVTAPPIYIQQDGLTLDCKNPVTGQNHTIGGATRQSAGVSVITRTNVKVRNCNITNVDFGFLASVAHGLFISKVDVSAPPSAPGDVAFSLHGNGITVQDSSVDGFDFGVRTDNMDALTLKNTTFKTLSTATELAFVTNLFLEDVSVDGSLFAPGASAPVGAVILDNSPGATLKRVSVTQASAFDSAIAAVFDSDATVEAAFVSGANRGIRLDGPGPSRVESSTLTSNQEGLVLLGGTTVVFHNNLFGNSTRQVYAAGAIELSDTRAASPTFQQGNYWGRSCPGTLFLAGVDSSRADVVDSYPYGQASAWTAGGTPGCTSPPVLAAPLLTSPTPGALLATATPTFAGTAAAGATVEVREGGVTHGSATADSAGRFEVVPTVSLSEGAHTVVAKASLGGAVSADSAPLTFTIDTLAPSAPVLVFPTPGITLAESSLLGVGTAEANARVHLEEGAALLVDGMADAAGQFSLRVPWLAAGAHTLIARATDAAGNTSPASAPVSFTVTRAPTGVAGHLKLTSVYDAPDAFEPNAGESNTLHLEGTMTKPSGGGASTYFLLLARRVYSQATGALVRTLSAQQQLTFGSGNSPAAFSHDIGWDGKDTQGVVVPQGVYASVTTMRAVRQRAGGGNSSGCLSTTSTGGCVFDEVDVVTTVMLVATPVVLRPPAAAPGTSLIEVAQAVVPTAQGVLIIPESAFRAALASGHPAPADDAAKSLAVDVAGKGNDSAALGWVGALHTVGGPQSFSGQVFIVARNPKTSGAGRFVETDDYFVAGVKLSGSAPWIGAVEGVAVSSIGPAPASGCCGEPKKCAQTSPGGPGGCGPAGLCLSYDTKEVLPGGVPQGPTELAFYGSPEASGTIPSLSYSCLAKVFPLCAQAQPLCDPADYLTPGNGGGGGGSQACGPAEPRIAPPLGPPVADSCKYGLWEDPPPECGGWSPNFGALTWSASGLPPSCALMQTIEGSELCNPHSAELREARNFQMKFNVLTSGCAGQAGLVSSQLGGKCCGANCVCGEVALGQKGTATVKADVCTECDNTGATGQCREFAERVWFDSNLAANDTGDGTTVEVLCHCHWVDEQCICQGTDCAGVTCPAKPVVTNEVSPVPDEQGLNTGTPPEPEAPPETNPSQVAQKGPGGAGDPILLGDGSFDIQQTDLSFDGPVRPLEFRRAYNSRGGGRSTLGSNWTHNWDVRLVVLREGIAPSWVPAYCFGTRLEPTCLLLHEGDRGPQLFYSEYGTGLFLPQAGSTDTVAVVKPQGGWALRRADGSMLLFDADGYLRQDRDRFGNGFTIDYEKTPLGELYAHHCAESEVYSDKCAVLAYLVGDGARPDAVSPAWQVTASTYPISSLLDSAVQQRLLYAREYFLALLRTGPRVRQAFGAHAQRPSQIRDDTGRTLQFTYYQAPSASFFSSQGIEGMPHVELLHEVRGPAGTKAEFSYRKPANHPPLLGEQFLVKVTRQDSPSASHVDILAAPARTIDFAYQWPENSAPSYSPQNEQDVYSRYLDYYATFRGCAYTTQPGPCAKGTPQLTILPGNPALLAREAANEYVSDVADNIIQVTTSGKVESETRYDADPFSIEFDRVLAQRYGASQATQDVTKLPPDVLAFNWQSQLPRMVMEYRPAGIASGGDETDALLPAAIKSRYPVEDGSNFHPPEFHAGPNTASSLACRFDLVDVRRKLLPGYRKSLLYFEAASMPGPDDGLKRSALSCEALAFAQVADPTHNELVSKIEADSSTSDKRDALVSRVIGGRKRIAKDANRICAWSKVIDRDGDTRYFGLNYRGQVLVDALAERSGGYLFKERVYNADGNVIQDRRPTRAPSWSATEGYTSFEYHDNETGFVIDMTKLTYPFWVRRQHLLRVEERPKGGSVTDVAEGPALAVGQSVGRFQQYSYEPFFQQVLSFQEGALGPQSSTIHRSVVYDYDYQELDPDAPLGDSKSLLPVYLALAPFGFASLPAVPFAKVDLNGDGVLGFAHPPGLEHLKARGAVVRVTQRQTPTSSDSLVYTYTWAPHGQPASIKGPDGSTVRFDYYSLAAPYGNAAPPASADVSSSNRGFLGRIQVRRLDESYPLAYGPSAAPCQGLRGPYQWVLSGNCSSPSTELAGLGLHQAAIDQILAASGAAGASEALTTAFSYSVLGKVRHTWLPTGTMHAVRDADGRERVVTDVLGNQTEHQYDVYGFAIRTLRKDELGNPLGDTERRFDDEGQLLFECTETEAGGCNGTLASPNGVASEYAYTPEGQLFQAKDSEGLVTQHSYDERKLPSQTTLRPSSATAASRRVAYAYNDDGNIERVEYGLSSAQPLERLEEFFVYDGLRRLKEYADKRGYRWQLGYSSRDVLSRYKQDAAAYGFPGGAPAWETYLAYDVFGRLVERGDNGLSTTKYSLTKEGRVFAVEATGLAKSFTTYDFQGRPLWSVDGAGNQSLYTWRPAPHIETESSIRIDDTGARVATSLVRTLNALGHPLEETEGGGAQTRAWVFRRTAAGFVREVVNPEGFLTQVTRNFLGWPKEVREESSSAPGGFEIATYEYDSRGQAKRVVDPSGYVTQIFRDELGDVRRRVVEGSPTVDVFFDYDSLGRLSKRTSGVSTIGFEYDVRGDAVVEKLLPGGQLLSERAFDTLGRVVSASNYNPALSWLAEGARTVRQTLSYDGLGRVATDGLRVGGGALREVSSAWSLSAQNTWQRQNGYLLPGPFASSSWTQHFDGVGRLSEMDVLGRGTSFAWQGEWYLGRTQRLSNKPSPFREKRTLDALGQLFTLEYRALDVFPGGQPVNAAEGASYCGGSWSAGDCAGPLLGIETLRDRMGRVASLQWGYGHPVLNAGGSRVPATHPKPWRGYAYDELSRLTKTWEHPGVGSAVSTSGLFTHFVTTQQVQQLGSASDAWRYQREATVGGTLAISHEVTSQTRWQGSRGSGHQLQTATVDGQGRILSHDAEGRLASDGVRTFEYDARGQLAVVRAPTGAVQEAYAYDDFGRMVAVFTGSGVDESFLYDGVHMVASFDGQGGLAWEARWGPGIDSLVGWRDVAGGTGTHVPLVDSRNSVVASWSDADGKLTERAEYTPEGRVLRRDAAGSLLCEEEGTGQVCPGVAGMPFSFASAWKSDRSGLVYMRNRWYSPELGEFLSHDAIGYRDSFNLYAYVAFDPINKRDPFGLVGVEVRAGAQATEAIVAQQVLKQLSTQAPTVVSKVAPAAVATAAGSGSAAAVGTTAAAGWGAAALSVLRGLVSSPALILNVLLYTGSQDCTTGAGCGSPLYTPGPSPAPTPIEEPNACYGPCGVPASFPAGRSPAPIEAAKPPKPSLPPGMTERDLGELLKWPKSRNPGGPPPTTEELAKKGVTKEILEKWKKFYEEIAKQFPENPSAGKRVPYLDELIKKMTGGTSMNAAPGLVGIPGLPSSTGLSSRPSGAGPAPSVCHKSLAGCR